MEISSGMVQIATEAGRMPAFLARPSVGGPYPGVVVVMEAFGLNGHIKEVAKRVAGEGYAALAVDLYYRQQSPVVGYDNLPEAIRLMSNLSDTEVVQDMGAGIAYLKQQEFCLGDRIGVVGFCMGGRVAFLTACRNADVKAAVPFYGGGIGTVMQPSERTPTAPIEYAESLGCPVMLIYGGDDPFIPPEEVERIKVRLAELRKPAEVIVYPGAPHGFFCNERDAYRADAAQDAWGRLVAFLGTHLGS
jgi:carboxymethylenebutenolidase